MIENKNLLSINPEDIQIENINGIDRHIYDGEVIYDNIYSYIRHFNDTGTAVVIDHKGQWFHIGMGGDPLYEERYEKHLGEFDWMGTAVARINGEWTHIGMDGKPLYEERYEFVTPFDDNHIAEVQMSLINSLDGGLWRHIDMDGKPLYKELYSTIKRFSDDGKIAQVCDSGKWLLIGRDGTPLHQLRFDTISSQIIKDDEKFYTAMIDKDVYLIKVVGENNDGIPVVKVFRRKNNEVK